MLATHFRGKLIDIDKKLSYQLFSLNRKYNHTGQKYLKALEYSCHGIPWLMFVSICFYMSSRTKSEFYAQLLTGLIFDIIYIVVFKSFARRCRPTYASQEDSIMISVDKLSFPSGHASRSIYLALFFSQYWFSSIVWLWAIAVTISRVLYGRHFLGDIFGGVLVGYWNYITQFSLFYPLHSFLMWFLMNLITNVDDFGDY